MIWERFIGIQRAQVVLISRTMPEETKKRINKAIYRKDFDLSGVARKYGGYRALYNDTMRHLHERMIRGEV